MSDETKRRMDGEQLLIVVVVCVVVAFLLALVAWGIVHTINSNKRTTIVDRTRAVSCAKAPPTLIGTCIANAQGYAP